MVERWGGEDSYYNWLCYPNMHIACPNGGYSFTLEHHVPVAPDRTDPVSYTHLDVYKRQDSLAALETIVLFDTDYGKVIVGDDIKRCITVGDLYALLG